MAILVRHTCKACGLPARNVKLGVWAHADHNAHDHNVEAVTTTKLTENL